MHCRRVDSRCTHWRRVRHRRREWAGRDHDATEQLQHGNVAGNAERRRHPSLSVDAPGDSRLRRPRQPADVLTCLAAAGMKFTQHDAPLYTCLQASHNASAMIDCRRKGG
jgi:hypothetical protein